MQSKRRTGAISLVTGSQSWQQSNIFLMKLIKRSGFFYFKRTHQSTSTPLGLFEEKFDQKKQKRLQNLEELPRVMGVIWLLTVN